MSRHRSLATAIAIGLTAVLLIFSVIIPMYRKSSLMMGKIKNKSGELDGLVNKVSLISKLDPSVLAERVEILDSALPPRKDVLLYLASIEGLSKELGLTFGGLSISPGELNEATVSATKSVKNKTLGLQTLGTEIKMRGSEESIYTFLRTIEEVLPLMQIENIKVGIIGEGQYSLNLTLGMLWAPSLTADLKGAIALFDSNEDKYFKQLGEYRRFAPIVSSDDNREDEPSASLFAPFTINEITTQNPASNSGEATPQP